MSKPKSRKAIPKFRDETAERHFWESHDTSDYVDWARALKVKLPDLKPSTTTISLRLPADVLEELKQLANRKDVPYQSLLKMLLAESLARERRPARRKRSAVSLQRLRAARTKAGLSVKKSTPRRRRKRPQRGTM